MVDLASSSVIVTGGASGLGAAAAAALAAKGARVVVVDIDVDGGKATASTIGGVFAAADVADEAAVSNAVEVAVGLGPLRGLVACAGGGGKPYRTVDRDGVPFRLDKFESVLRLNTVGSFNCARLAAAAMSANEPVDGERGAIVNTASAAAFEGQVGQVAYAAAKAAIVGMTLPLARDLAPIGVRVNTVAPGLVDTPIYGTGDRADAFKASLVAHTVFPKRLGRPEEFARLVIELLENSLMNGETVRLDGAIRLPYGKG